MESLISYNQGLSPGEHSFSATSTANGFVELGPNELCYIDLDTAKFLELLENNVDTSNRRHSLFGYLNVNICTTTGSRLLGDSLMRPLCHLATIEHRLDCIEYLNNRIDTLSTITNCIKRFGQNVDLETVAPVLTNLSKLNSSSMHVAEKRLEAISTIENLIAQVPILATALAGTDQTTLNIYRVALEDPAYKEIAEHIHSIIESDVKAGRGKRGKVFRIRKGVEVLFDIARSTYNAAINDLEQYVRELNQEDRLPWKLSYGETRGYYLTLSTDHVPKDLILDKKYIRVNKTRSLITCTTQELMHSNVRANVSYENSMKLANEILKSTLMTIHSYHVPITRLIELVGMLDLITSFAKLVANSNGSLVRPRFTATDTIISKGRHPVLESVLAINNLPVVPNDTVFSVGHKNFMLVSGPNMGGKSIFLKQVALIQIMAQIGCYISAENGHIKLMNRIVARSGTSDDNYSNCSSFMWEMKGIASALVTDESSPNHSVLYVIDEVGRGTSTDDGTSYSFAIAEELASRPNSFTVFATHFCQVFSMANIYGNVMVYHFRYEELGEEDDEAKFKISHELVPGIADKCHYGIRLAEACGFPDEILRLARKDLAMYE